MQKSGSLHIGSSGFSFAGAERSIARLLSDHKPPILSIPDLSRFSPYVTALPYLATAVLEGHGIGVKIIKPPVRFQDGPRGVWKSLEPFCDTLCTTPRRLRQAIAEAWQAQDEFENACRARGREVLADLDAAHPAVVLIGRAYNTCDPGVCLDLPKKLRQLGVLPIPMDFLDLGTQQLASVSVRDNMYWTSGQAILRAAEIVRDDPRLNAVYLSNFGCGPDSFLGRRGIQGGKAAMHHLWA
jgi:predicted nucleotide-binding protein (sugar kinase/HSP70/actin superfamily)